MLDSDAHHFPSHSQEQHTTYGLVEMTLIPATGRWDVFWGCSITRGILRIVLRNAREKSETSWISLIVPRLDKAWHTPYT